MIAPAVVLVLLGVFLSFTPRLKFIALMSSEVFQDSTAYAGRVLENAATPLRSVPAPAPDRPLFGGIVLALAAAGAVLYLLSGRFRSAGRWITAPLRVLHRLHSGHIGDYVAFLTFGIAAFGLVCVFFL
jgi:multicomponent Na+:H+ antiporter subunit D